MKEWLTAIGEHPVAFIGLTIAVCLLLEHLTDLARSLKGK